MTKVVKDQGGLTQINNKDFHTCMFACFLSQEEPKRVHQALKDPSWIEAMQEELLQFKMQNVWVLVDLPDGKRAIGFKDPHYPDKVYKVVKALYGLNQAPRACQDKYVAEILRKFGLTDRKLASTPIDTEKPLLKDRDGEDVDVHTYKSMIVDEKVGIEVCAVDLKVTTVRLIVTTVSSKFLLFDCLPNEEILTKLLRMGYEKPSTKLTFYNAFFSPPWKFLIHTILQCMTAKRTSWNEFSFSMASAVICLSTVRKFIFSKYVFDSLVRNVDSSTKFYIYLRFLQLMIRSQGRKGIFKVETPLFEGMIVAQQADDVANEGAAGVDVDVVPVVEPSIPSPTPTTQPPPPSQELPSTSQVIPTLPSSPIAQPPSPQQQPPSSQPLHDAEITKLKQRVKKLERMNKLKVSKLRRLKKVGTAQRVNTSKDTIMDDVSKQGEIIATMDADEDVTLKDVAAVAKEVVVEKDVEIKENADDDELEPAELKEVVEVVTTAKLMTEVVTAASTTITSATTPINVAIITTAPSAARRRKGVVIKDPKKSATPSIIIHSEPKSKDKGKGIMVEEPKPLKKEAWIEQDEAYA
nr:ribonuclease H-like domain, reverse transcriptase, RNA-dependent DNA polymerase [Tanacetum cinerariifolium]